MMRKQVLIPLALILMLVLAACSAPQTAVEPQAAAEEAMGEMAEAGDKAVDEMAEGESHDDSMDEMAEGESHDDSMGEMPEGGDKAMDEMAASPDQSMEEMAEGESMPAMDAAAWQTIALTDAVTGQSFTLADFQGKTVFVEPMATWCSNCRQQQGIVREAKAQLSDDVVFVGLSIEPNLPAADLAGYAQGNGFDWTYAVLPVEMLEQLAEEFGRSITTAPSTPHFIIRPDGSFTELSTGIHSAEEIIAQIEAARGS
jgi:thiol-disulfide isomerase/thioredoxin